jgi:hypothetical protein
MLLNLLPTFKFLDFVVVVHIGDVHAFDSEDAFEIAVAGIE